MVARRVALVGTLFTLAVLPLTAQSMAGNPAGVPAQGFGSALAIAGSELLVGRTNGFAVGNGDIVVYRKGTDGKWKESGTFSGTGLELNDGFASVLAADGTWLAVGAPGAKGGGKVYLFQRVAGRWNSVSTLASPDTTAAFGSSLAYQNGLLIVGAPGRDSLRGEVYAYRRDARGRMSAPVTIAKGTDAFDRFGFAVALDRNRLVVGAPGPGGGAPVPRRHGLATVYEANAAGAWREAAKLDAGPDTVLTFGTSVYIDTDGIVVGAPVTLANQGVAFIYTAGTAGWTLEQRLESPEARPQQGFGSSILRQGRTLFVGAPNSNRGAGVTHVFTRESDGWFASQALSGSASNSVSIQFGARLVMAGKQLIVAGPGADFQQGLAYLLERDADGLWRETGRLKDAEKLLAQVSGKKVDCASGKAAEFDCGNVDLLSFMPKSALGAPRGVGVNDLWGWTDPETSREYALVGRMDGTSFVDVTDPSSPRFVGDLPMHQGANANIWRDIKVYKDHAFIVADGSGPHGMQVFDLARLRKATGATPVTFTEDAHYDNVASAHNIVINEGSGYAYIVGANGGGETCGGALHMVNIHDPLHPAFAGCHADPATGIQRTGYTHDAQCVVYKGPDRNYTGHEICFNSSETGVGIADVTDKANPKKIAVATYPNTSYAHQGWLNEDQTYFYLDDEGDEIQGLVPKTRTLIWDVTNLAEPVLVKEHLGETAASDHNLYIRGNLMYQSDYVAGLRVLDITNPAEPKEVGYFDTVPVGENAPGFAGSWSNYPYFKSGTVIVTSVGEGLFAVRYHPMQAMVP